jgi:hypothetical protein
MALIHDIRGQSKGVRLLLWALSVFVTLSAFGFVWFTSLEKSMYFAMHSDPKEQAEFLARQEDRTPKPLAAIGRGFGKLAASIGSVLGFDSNAGFDRPAQEDKVYMLPLSK